MKTLFVFCIMACAMSAQDFHGISIGGTIDAPTLINNSGKPVMAYVVQKFTSSNVNPVTTVPHVYDLVRGLPVQGPLGLIFGMQRGYVDHATGKRLEEGATIRWELKGLLFADGTHYGSGFEQLSRMFANFRSFAQELQQQGSSTWAATVARMGNSIPRSDSEAIVYALQGLPENEWAAAIARVAALPGVVKGK